MPEPLISGHRPVKAVLHIFKPLYSFLDKRVVNYLIKVFFAGKVKLIDLKSLFQEAGFKFDQVPVIPRKDSDLALGMGYFSYYTHKALVQSSAYKAQSYEDHGISNRTDEAIFPRLATRPK
jgi:hypothetical protein